MMALPITKTNIKTDVLPNDLEPKRQMANPNEVTNVVYPYLCQKDPLS